MALRVAGWLQYIVNEFNGQDEVTMMGVVLRNAGFCVVG